MNKRAYPVITFAIFFLFLIQTAGTLVESIYILDLMNTSLDEKVLGLLFFFTPAILLIFPRKLFQPISWIAVVTLAVARGLTPYLDTSGRMLASGIGLGSTLILLPFLLSARLKGQSNRLPGSCYSAGFALSISLSVLLRTVAYGLDYSLFPEGAWAGWLLAALLVAVMSQLDWNPLDQKRKPSGSVTLSMIGVFLVAGLSWFAFSAPAVIARWTEGNYRLIIMAVSLFSLIWIGLALGKPDWTDKIAGGWLLAWNLVFTLALTLTLLAQRIPFPPTPESAAIVVVPPGWGKTLPLVLTLLLYPVIFLDLQRFVNRIRQNEPGAKELIPGTLLGSLVLVLLVFAQIFTNVWGYVEPISPWFRNKFWLPYFLLSGLITLLLSKKRANDKNDSPDSSSRVNWRWSLALGVLFLATLGSVLITTRIRAFQSPTDSLVVMTYNIQEANGEDGERSYRQQLALIRQVDPDILALQESDSTRISLNNNDYVRYYAGKLGYHSYYGPTTVTGTYGTAILSKYPLENTQTVFTFSNQDEVGTSEAQVTVNGKLFTIYDVHPDGSDTAMLVWAETLLKRSQSRANVISLGDYNLRDYEQPYQLIDSVYKNAWTTVYPSKISPDGTDMSGENRIDHIFVSPGLEVRNPVYILPPESATDHPVHWAEIFWED
jgi:endonuclease/exonuclease/phosphatase family metal-dependent hydrolase